MISYTQPMSSRMKKVTQRRKRVPQKTKRPAAISAPKNRRPITRLADYSSSSPEHVDGEDDEESADDGDGGNQPDNVVPATRGAARPPKPPPNPQVIATADDLQFSQLNISRAKLGPDYVPMRPDYYGASASYKWTEMPPNFRQIPFGTKNKPGLKIPVDPNWTAIDYFELMLTPAVIYSANPY